MIDEVDGGEAPRKGKSNAILTYETVAGLRDQLTGLSTKFDGLIDTLRERKGVQDTHDLALRALELRLTVMETSSGTSRKFFSETWAVLIAILSLAVSAVSGASSVIWHIR